MKIFSEIDRNFKNVIFKTLQILSNAFINIQMYRLANELVITHFSAIVRCKHYFYNLLQHYIKIFYFKIIVRNKLYSYEIEITL
jgi:hypothetical protein